MGHAVGMGIDLSVTERFGAIDQKGPVSTVQRLRFKAVGQGVQVGGFDPRAGGCTHVKQRLGVLARYGLLACYPAGADRGHVIHGASAPARG